VAQAVPPRRTHDRVRRWGEEARERPQATQPAGRLCDCAAAHRAVETLCGGGSWRQLVQYLLRPIRTASLCLSVPLCASLCLCGPLCASLCLSVPLCASLCLSVPLCASVGLSVPLCASLGLSVPLCASLCLSVLHTYVVPAQASPPPVSARGRSRPRARCLAARGGSAHRRGFSTPRA
jgi:hypothetical protein